MNRTVLFALHRLSYLRLEEKLKLLRAFPREDVFSRLTRYEAEWLLGRKLRCRSFAAEEMLERAHRDGRNTESAGIQYTSYGEDSYPGLLKEIYDPPLVLFWKGSLPPRDRAALAVVGTRKPTLEADRSAFCLGLDAARGGIPLISGMAAGVDGAAHKGSLAMQGRTWAVLGTGCDRPYPSFHRSLAAEILARGGGLVSEFFPGTGPARYNFPRRNRIISGLSTHVVVVQAPQRSGALYTADFALDQGRDVAVHRSGLTGRNGRGTALLHEQGAPVIDTLRDLFSQVPDPGGSREDVSAALQAEPEKVARLAALSLRQEMEGALIFYKGRTHG